MKKRSADVDLLRGGKPEQCASDVRFGIVRTLRTPTPRQRQILAFVHAFTTDRGYPPTMREIGDRFGMSSTNAVSDHLRALERRGLVIRYDYQARSVRVTAEGLRALEREPPVSCPTCGRPQ